MEWFWKGLILFLVLAVVAPLAAGSFIEKGGKYE